MGVFTLRSVALVAGLAACASEASTSRAPQGIEDGVADTVHPNVVGILNVRDGSVAACTGSLVAPTLVLTARHCVSPITEGAVVCAGVSVGGVGSATTRTGDPYPAATFSVTTEATLSTRGTLTAVTEVLTPPGSTGLTLCGNDLALLRLSSSIAVTSLRPRLDAPPAAHERFTAIGYGATDALGDGDGQRRMRDGLRVLAVGRALDGDSVVREASEWQGDTGTCRGDSGGPALDALGEVIGVLSRGLATGCESPIYTRLDSFSAWIREQASRASALGGYATPSWVAVPAAVTDTGCDLATGGGRRAGHGLGLLVLAALGIAGARARSPRRQEGGALPAEG